MQEISEMYASEILLILMKPGYFVSSLRKMYFWKNIKVASTKIKTYEYFWLIIALYLYLIWTFVISRNFTHSPNFNSQLAISVPSCLMWKMCPMKQKSEYNQNLVNIKDNIVCALWGNVFLFNYISVLFLMCPRELIFIRIKCYEL